MENNKLEKKAKIKLKKKSSFWTNWAIIAAAVLGIILIFVIFYSKKKFPTTPTPTAPVLPTSSLLTPVSSTSSLSTLSLPTLIPTTSSFSTSQKKRSASTSSLTTPTPAKQSYPFSFSLVEEYEKKVIENLRFFFENREFIDSFNIIYRLSSFLAESEESDFGEKVIEYKSLLTENFLKNAKKNLEEDLIKYTNVYGAYGVHGIFNKTKDTSKTKEEKINKFINSFKNLFTFGFLKEAHKEKDDNNLFSEKNKKILFHHSVIMFKQLSKDSRKNMWKKFAMNIIVLLTPTNRAWIKNMNILFSTTEEEKIFLKLIKKLHSFPDSKTQRNKIKRYLKNLKNKKKLATEITKFVKDVLKIDTECIKYKNYFNLNLNMSSKGFTKEIEEKKKFKIILWKLFVFYSLRDKITDEKDLAYISGEKDKNKLILTNYFTFFSFFLTKKEKEAIWETASSSAV